MSTEDVVSVAAGRNLDIQLSPQARHEMERSRELKWRLINEGQPIYGVTTGVGDSADRQIGLRKAAALQQTIIRKNLCGRGPEASPHVVRAMLLIRANCLSRGSSAVNPDVVDRLLALIRHDVLPVVPERGSVGASGDLIPLAYVAAVVMGEGEVRYQGTVRPTADVYRELSWEPVILEPKDGLALLNGTSFSAAFATLALHAAARLAAAAEVCTAMASEALLGNRGHFLPFIHEQRPHPGQVTSARHIADLLRDSALALDHNQVIGLSEKLADGEFQRLRRSIQDRYSIRCAPQVIGVLRDTVAWAGRWVETEINSSNDNPLFEASSGMVYSGGNFYGGHLAQAMDALKLAVANIADLLDRQLELLVDEKFNNGLPANLIVPRAADEWDAGLHHGFKGMQLICSALTAEALKTSGPASVFSRSTEAHNQDKVSMSALAGREALATVDLVEEVAAIHLLAACQASELRGTEHMSPRTRAIHRRVRELCSFVERDRRMDRDIAAVVELLREGTTLDGTIPT
ncbi:histidine ammonia-lyase [Pendulispora albinea]|uniref:Aromatic amino acid ammonia-lyase n=1 Tax=Pendulispora albinea TaxID=2741071 RepID=A0ABZ2M9Z2_9BACT